jgi:uncharacterized protein (UPF0332 family)
MSVPNTEHLLEQADRLIANESRGAPRQIDLRRAISNAYYAVFHAIAAYTADTIVGRKYRSTPRYALAYRNVEHRTLRSLCDEVPKNKRTAKYLQYVPDDGFGSDIVAFAAAVVELQEKRHLADYDPLFRVRADSI